MGGDSFLGTTQRKVGFALTLLVLVALGLFAYHAVRASRSLLDARTRAEHVQTLIRAGDFTGAANELQRLQDDTRQAHAATDGIGWDLGRHLPFIGRDIGAVQTVSAVLDAAAAQNAPVALDLSHRVDAGQFRPHNGHIDLAVVKQLTPGVTRAARSIDDAAAELDHVRADRLIFPFNDLVNDLQGQVTRARSAADATATSFALLPQMLGDGGARTYLLMIQNPAELRSTGGLPGSLALLHADHGTLTMGWQGSATDINRGGFGGPVVKLAKDTALQYGDTPATDFRDLNFSPDFPEAAQIAKAMVQRRLGASIGGSIDGVVSIDPIALGGLMAGTGPIAVGNGITLSASNVATTLLNQTYKALPDPVAQDNFFQTVARKVFDSVLAGQGDQQQTIKGLGAAAGQHRILLWSAHADEEARIGGTAVAGQLSGAPERTPEVGMYFNDAVAGKVDYYLQYRSAVSAVDCRNDRSQDYRATMVLTSTVPSNFSDLSVWVLGDGTFAPRGTIAVNLRIYAPLGGSITGMTVDGSMHSVTADLHEGRQVAFLPIALKPGQQMTVSADIRTAKGQDGDGQYNFTPGMLPVDNGLKITSAC